MTISGHKRLNDEFSLIFINKCASTTFKRHETGVYCPPEAEITTPKAIAVIRHPLERVLSFYRMKVRSKIRPHYPNVDSFLTEECLSRREGRRDTHVCRYGRYLDGIENVLLVPLEELEERWPVDVPKPFGETKHNTTPQTGERPSPELEEAFEEIYLADYLMWEEAMADE